MINKNKLTLVLPCRDEEKAIFSVYKHLPKQIDEVIVVDNLSTDNTVKVAKQLGAKVFLEPRKMNGIGYGYALATGIKEATGDIIICMDGDGSYPTREIPRIVKTLLTNDLDFISCNRLPILKTKKMAFIRKFGVMVLNWVMFILYGYPIKDSLTGMWVFKRSTIPNLTIHEGDWNFSMEIKISAITNKNIRFDEYHIVYQDREFDQSKQSLFKTGFNHLIYLFKKKLPNKILFLHNSPKLSLLKTN